jgi:hypothetical protein
MALTFTGCGGSNKGYSSVDGTLVPNTVLDRFNDSYPYARDVKWDTDDGMYKVDFEMGNQDMKATYSPDGSLLEIDS